VEEVSFQFPVSGSDWPLALGSWVLARGPENSLETGNWELVTGN
jgi:hypothetical protein